MNNWFDRFADRARGLCSIERADSRDRGPSTGNRGGGGGGGGRTGSTGGGGGSMHQSAISQASRPAAPSPAQSPAGPGNATTADKYVADKYGLTPDQYDKATRQLRDTVLDARDFQDKGALNTIGKLLLSPFGYYEEDPSQNPSAAQRAWDQSMEDAKNGVTRPADSLANRRIDALQAATSLIGMGTGLPVGTLYNAGTAMFGHPENFAQINLGPSGGPSISNPGGNPTGPNGPDRTANAGHPLGVLGALAQSGTIPHPALATPPATTPPNDPNGALEAWKQIYQPYGGDYATYGGGQEHQFFAPAAMAEGGPVERAGSGGDTTLAHVTPGEIMLPPELYNSDPGLLEHILHSMHSAGMDPSQYIVGGGGEDEQNDLTGMPQYGFWKTIKKAFKHVAPMAIGTGAGVLTGSPIIGGLGGALSSKLFGNSWGEAALSGLGSGALSYFGPQLWDSASSMISPAALSGHQAAISQASTGGNGGLFDSALNFVKNNPLQVGGAALAGLAALNSATQHPTSTDLPASSANDPKLAAQIRNGQIPEWDRQATDTSNVDWYRYGEMPEWDYFINEDKYGAPATQGLKRGGLPANGRGVLSQLHNAGGMADGPGGGQDDKIPVYLSAKEYVVPADVVSDLGDGNPDHGARKLDSMRDKVRKQKGRSGFPKKAHATVEKYL